MPSHYLNCLTSNIKCRHCTANGSTLCPRIWLTTCFFWLEAKRYSFDMRFAKQKIKLNPKLPSLLTSCFIWLEGKRYWFDMRGLLPVCVCVRAWCTWVCVCVCVCVCLSVSLCVCVGLCLAASVSVSVHTYTQIHCLCVCPYVCINVHTCSAHTCVWTLLSIFPMPVLSFVFI